MDEYLRQALAKWPNVPDVYGWLRLDQRGIWRLKHDPVRRAALTDYLNRYYMATEQGEYYVQNGPQKVFVQLDFCPWVIRLSTSFSENGQAHKTVFLTHTGTAVQKIDYAAIDGDGRLYLVWQNDDNKTQIGLIDDRDLAALASSHLFLYSEINTHVTSDITASDGILDAAILGACQHAETLADNAVVTEHTSETLFFCQNMNAKTQTQPLRLLNKNTLAKHYGFVDFQGEAAWR